MSIDEIQQRNIKLNVRDCNLLIMGLPYMHDTLGSTVRTSIIIVTLIIKLDEEKIQSIHKITHS